ncbi:MAG: ATP-binding protein [Gammaproteobacteria bacterium]|nr:ATP-binding protein [Gammaproteobacteria bacterium]
MDAKLIAQIHQMNPWLQRPETPILPTDHYVPRLQTEKLALPDWDRLVTILVGPRQAGKTTLGKFLCQEIIKQGRFEQLLFLTCDSPLIRHWLDGIHIINELIEEFELTQFILFIDEVQRLENPGLFLKSLVDLNLKIKLIVTGSSQLEIKSKVQEHLTGRQFEAIILPLSHQELGTKLNLEAELIYGCYPQIILGNEKRALLSQLYQNYINRDIVEILRVRNPLVLEKIMMLIAHSSGQLLNYQTLANDCNVSVTMIRHYLSVLEKTYVLQTIYPFTGNKRTEITSNPKCYYIDNGFRNQALGNFSPVDNRTDNGLLVESAVFQEILKYKVQHFLDFKINFWRTKSGAEVDFVLYKNLEFFYPIEVKYQNFKKPTISRSFRSFIDAYQPQKGFIITRDFNERTMIDKTEVIFIPLRKIKNLFSELNAVF